MFRLPHPEQTEEASRDKWKDECSAVNSKLVTVTSERDEAVAATQRSEEACAGGRRKLEAAENALQASQAACKAKADEVKQLDNALEEAHTACETLKAELAAVPGKVDAAVEAAKAALSDEWTKKLQVATASFEAEISKLKKAYEAEINAFEEVRWECFAYLRLFLPLFRCLMLLNQC